MAVVTLAVVGTNSFSLIFTFLFVVVLSDLVTCVNIFVYLPSPPHPSDLLQNPLIVPVKILKGHRVTGELGECIVVIVALFCGALSSNRVLEFLVGMGNNAFLTRLVDRRSHGTPNK